MKKKTDVKLLGTWLKKIEQSNLVGQGQLSALQKFRHRNSLASVFTALHGESKM
jgi:hypothetical protein